MKKPSKAELKWVAAYCRWHYDAITAEVRTTDDDTVNPTPPPPPPPPPSDD